VAQAKEGKSRAGEQAGTCKAVLPPSVMATNVQNTRFGAVPIQIHRATGLSAIAPFAGAGSGGLQLVIRTCRCSRLPKSYALLAVSYFVCELCCPMPTHAHGGAWASSGRSNPADLPLLGIPGLLSPRRNRPSPIASLWVKGQLVG
jgi:hypothetical protein